MVRSPIRVQHGKHMFTRMYSRVAGIVWSGVIAGSILASGPVLALDGNAKSRAASAAPLKMFKDPHGASLQGAEARNKGDVATSLSALKYAADGGEPLAAWKLGWMYSRGEGVPKNDLAAYRYYFRIVRDYNEDQLRPAQRSIVSSAFVAVGAYYLTGIPNSKVHRNLQRAMHLFHYAATSFRDANAQYNLARMYLDGAGTERSPSKAVRWLRVAAEKNHVEALAVLGNLLFVGDSGVARRRAKGLMYLTLASELAGSSSRLMWVNNLHDKALHLADQTDREMARIELKKHLRHRSRGR